MHIIKQKRGKFDQIAQECVFVGYWANKVCRVVDLNNPKQILKTRDIIFIEDEYPAKLLKRETNDPTIDIGPKNLLFNDVITLTTNRTMEGKDNVESERRETTISGRVKHNESTQVYNQWKRI